MRIPKTALAAVAAGLAMICPATAVTPKPMSSEIAITRGTVQGWPDAIVLGNGVVEAVIVPAVGRVMQFRFVGDEHGPFWVNPGLVGTKADPASRDWANFGGDKVWPAPQADWTRLAGRPWPPPAGFDGLPMKALDEGSAVTLVSGVDANYGIRVRRRIELAAGRPVMTITTRFEKVAGPPIDVGVWTVTQAREPAVVCAVLPDTLAPGDAYVLQSETPPAGLKIKDHLLTLTRDTQKNTKLGVRAGTLVWVGERELLRVDSPLVAGARYPDQDCSAEIYTNADPLPYVELETLGPLQRLAVGGSIERQSTYTLARRAGTDPLSDVRSLLAR